MSDTTLIKYLGEEGTSALIDKIKQILSHKPDFAQNDPTHSDYIKNRTHWIEEGSAVLLPETTITFNYGESLDTISSVILEEGETYVVAYDGIKYKCPVQMFDMSILVGSNEPMLVPIIGNLSTIEMENTGEPFAMMYLEPKYAELIGDSGLIISDLSRDDEETYEITISISKSGEIVHKLDNKFLDLDWLPTMIDSQELILQETPITLSNSTSSFNGLIYDTIIVGEKYAVNILGSTFVCEAYKKTVSDINDCIFLGNPKLVDDNEENNGLPFFILVADEAIKLAIGNVDCMIVVGDTLASENADITLSIGKPIKTPNKLPNEYLDMDWYASNVIKEEELVPVHEIVGDVHMFVDGVNELPEIIVGQTYNVYINDTCYECTAVKAENNCIYLGNSSLAGLGENTKEPFYVCYTPEGVQGGNSMYYDRFKRGDIVRITKPYSEPNKLPSKYLPDDFVKGVSAFYVTVTANEDGTFSADKTFEEISEAYEAGMSVYCKVVIEVGCSILPLTDVRDDNCSFLQAGEQVCSITINNDNLVSVNMVNLALAEDVPTITSALTNDSGFITKAVNNLANYYLKSETYSQSEINSLLSSIPKFTISVVSTLPTTNISNTTVYLVPSDEEEHDLYTEYIYVNNKWETLGRQKMDLSGFVTKEEVKNHTQVQIIRWEEND